MFKSKTILYSILLVLITIVVASYGENIKNRENFKSNFNMSDHLGNKDEIDLHNIKTENLDTNASCKFDMQCKSNECIKDVGGQLLCL